MSRQNPESLRRSYLPKPVRLLLIGESRPNGNTFFYEGDSFLARYTAEAFGRSVDSNAGTFLSYFKSQGAYLEDLCPMPINHLPRPDRTAHRRAHVKALTHKLLDLQPRAIAVVMKAIIPHVTQAIEAAQLVKVPVRYLPFPAQGHQRDYVQQLRQYISKLRKEGVLHGVA